jgi:hypothetical protein
MVSVGLSGRVGKDQSACEIAGRTYGVVAKIEFDGD